MSKITNHIIQQRENNSDREINYKIEARLSYSPKCVDCEWYYFTDDICKVRTDENPYPIYPQCNNFNQRNDDYCSNCGKPYQENIDEDIVESDGTEEFWGAMVQRPDVLVGFVCSECGKYNEFT